MILPNFIILGAAKAGTTAIYHYMSQHPHVGMSRVKETNYFALEGGPIDFRGPGDRDSINRFSVNTAEGYQEQFRHAEGADAIGEVSPLYLYSEEVPGRLARSVPRAKLIAILRDPAERAYSAFLHLIRDGRETTADFAEGLRLEDSRVADRWEHIWHYRRMGLYHDQLRRYFDRFDRDQIRVHTYQDFRSRPAAILADLFRFIGVDDSFAPDMSIRYNAAAVPAERRPPLDPQVLDRLRESFRDDVLALQDLLGRDLSGWLPR